MFADGYEPDEALINETLIQAKQRAEEFSNWAIQLPTNDVQMVIKSANLGPISSASFSPDSNLVISSLLYDKKIVVWEISTGRELNTITGHTGQIRTTAFSPDGKQIASGATDKMVKLWETSSGKELHTFYGHESSISSVVYSPDGRYILSGSYDKNINIWDIQSSKLVRTLKGHTDAVTSIAVSSDSKTAISASLDKSIKLWNISTGELIKTFNGHMEKVNSVAISPDGQYALSGSGKYSGEDHKVRLWDIRKGELINTLAGHSREVLDVTFSPDGAYAISGSADGSTIVWDLYKGQLLYKAYDHSTWVTSVAVSHDGQYYLSGSNDGSIKINDLLTGTSFQTLEALTKGNLSVSISKEGNYALMGSWDKTMKLWNVKTGGLIRVFKDNLSGGIFSTAISPDNKFAVSGTGGWGGGYNDSIKLWKVDTGELIYSLEDHSEDVNSVVFSPNGKYILSGSSDNSIKLRDPGTGNVIRTFSGHLDRIHSVAFSSDGKTILSGSSDKTIKHWDVNTGNVLHSFEGHTAKVCSVVFSPNGKYILSGSADRTIRLWDIGSGKIIHNLDRHKDTVFSAIFSPNNQYILSGSRDNTIKLWDVSSGKLLNTMDGHNKWIRSVAFTPDGLHAFSVSDDGTQKFWNIPDGELIYTSMANSEGEYLTWTPEGYFFGSEGLAKEAVYFVDGFKTFTIDQFFETYYRPDIIQAKIAGKDISELVGNKRLADSILPTPEVTIEVVRTGGKVQVKVSATDKGGGAEEIRLFHNGVRVSGTNRGVAVVSNSDTITQTFAIQLINGDNSLRALAFTANRIESTPSVITISYTAPHKVEPTLWVLAVGINEYKNRRYNLNYAVNDADSFIGAVKKSGDSLFKSIETTLLTDKKATRQGIINALERITARAKPEDVFMFFYAGHGIALESEETERTEFFFIPTDVTQMTDLSKVMDLGLAGPEFEILVSSIPARKQFLVLDACNSGAINTAFGVRGAAEEIALSRLSRATGSALIAASRDDQFAQEFAALGQGALTKALLDGLGGNAAQSNGQITVGSLKGYVESALPGLTEQYAGQAQYPTGFIFGQDFPIGVK